MNNVLEKYEQQEWLSFQIECSTHPKHGKGWVNCTKQFIVYSPHDSDGYVVCMDKDHATLITKDSVVCIYNDYQEIAVVFNNPEGNEYYDWRVAEEVDHYFTLAGLYAPLVKEYTHADWSQTESFQRANGKWASLPGEIKMKVCTETECHIITDTLNYYYNLEKKYVDSLVFPQGDTRTCQVLSDLKQDNKKTIVDSIFNLTETQYKRYYFQRGDTISCNHSFCNGNYEMNDSILFAPLISVARLDTLRIKDLEGWTLLCLWGNFKGSLDVITQSLENRKMRKVLDNILFVMPYCENIELARTMSQYEKNKNSIYCSRHLNSHLSTQYMYYLISPEKKIVYKSMMNELGPKDRATIMCIIKQYNKK